jgi:NADPH:quinone reductase-like Zn-dependent oxidoreductase
VDVHAAPITPLDVLCATGRSYFGCPPLPYVPGVQGVGIVRQSDSLPAGTPVWFSTIAGMQPGDGSLATSCSVPEAHVVVLEKDTPANLVAALGLSSIAAWMALTWRGELQPDEQVIVLGAGGMVGQVAVQAARALGARRVIAGCRSDAAADRASRHGADAVVRLDTEDVDVLASRFQAAAQGAVDLVLDPLFGPAATAAIRTLRPYGRLVNLGGSASPTAVIDSATLRSGPIRLLGYTNTELTADQRSSALQNILRLAAAGNMSVDFETVTLDQVPDSWSRQASGNAAARQIVDFTATA